MDFRQLETFVKVAELKSFSKAAQENFITQPTVSEHIRQLESELNTKLFLRTKRETLLTPAGKVFFKHAQKILEARRRVLLEMGQFSTVVAGDLSLGASSIPGEYILPGILGRFHQKYPRIRAELFISDSKKAMEWVLERRCEVGFIGFKPHHKLLEVSPFSSDTIAPVVHASHPLASHENLRLEDLQTVPLALREPGSGTRRAVEQALNRKGLSWKTFRVALVVGSATAVINAVMTGAFVSFLSLKSVQNGLDGGTLKVLAISDFPPLHREFFMIRGRNDLLSPLAQHLIRYIDPTVSPFDSSS